MADAVFGRGAPLPERGGPPLYPVWWLKESDLPTDYTILSEDWWGCWVHWCAPDGQHPRGRSRLCVESVEPCPWHAAPREWCAYLDVWHHRESRPGGLVVTPTLARDLVPLSGQFGGLLGVRVTVWHTGRRNGGGVRGRLSDQPRVQGELRRIDLQPTLQRVWGLPRTPAEILIPTGVRDTIPFPEPTPDAGRYGLGEAKGGVR